MAISEVLGKTPGREKTWKEKLIGLRHEATFLVELNK